jgi:hypothetical protein
MNKNWSLIIIVFLANFVSSFAQDSSKVQQLGVRFSVTDFSTLNPIYQQQYTPSRVFFLSDLNFAVDVGYTYQLDTRFSIGGMARIGSANGYFLLADTVGASEQRVSNMFYSSLNGLAMYHPFEGASAFSPYVFGGLGVDWFQKEGASIDLQAALGIGLKLYLIPDFALNAKFEYRESLFLKQDNLILSFGFIWKI